MLESLTSPLFRSLALGVLVIAGEAAPARAADELPAAEASEVRAKAEFRRGAEAYRARRYREAIAHFTKADALAPRPGLSFDIARAYDRLGEARAAAEHYRRYLEREPRARNADEVKARLNELETAEVLSTGGTAPGLVSAAGASEAGSTPATVQDAAEDDRERAEFAPWSWLTLGTGGVALLGALVAEVSRRSAESDARSASSQLEYAESIDAMNARKTTARVLLATGAALTAVGGTLVAIDLSRRERRSVSVACGQTACLARVGGSF